MITSSTFSLLNDCDGESLCADVIEVTVSGKKEITSIKIAKEAVDPDDVEMLEDLITAAVNEGLRKMEDLTKNRISAITGGIGGGMGGLF